MSAHVRLYHLTRQMRAAYHLRNPETPRMRDPWLYWLFSSELSRG